MAVVQATVTHILSSVPVMPKYGFPLPTAVADFSESELAMDREVRGGNRDKRSSPSHITYSSSFSHESNFLYGYMKIEAIHARIDLTKGFCEVTDGVTDKGEPGEPGFVRDSETAMSTTTELTLNRELETKLLANLNVSTYT